MPVGRYFVWSAVSLLALLFLADRYLPEPSCRLSSSPALFLRPAREAFAQLPSAPPAARLRAAERLPKSVAVKRAARSRPLANRVANYQGPRGLFDVGW